MALHDSLKDARNRMGMSQEVVAEQLGISRQAVTKWELGQSKPSAKNLQALAELYQISTEELLAAAQKKGPNLILRTNLVNIAIIGQMSCLNSAAHHLYMFRIQPDDGGHWWAFIISLVALLLCSTWMVSNHRFEPNKDQRRKNTKIELLYCSIQALIGLLVIHFGIGFAGTALILAVCLSYVFCLKLSEMFAASCSSASGGVALRCRIELYSSALLRKCYSEV